MSNKPRIILDLCGGTGAWSRPYKEAGYEVRVITLPDWDVCLAEYSDKCLIFPSAYQSNDSQTSIPFDWIYGILAAPPCTEFSLAKNGSHTPRNLKEGMKVVEACMQIIWMCQQKGNLKFWALENPLGLLRKFLGRPKFSFKQWEFGDPGVKPTDIWGFFNEPRKTVKEMPGGITKRYKSGKVNTLAWAAPKHPEYSQLKLSRAALRAVTPAGFAEAFFKANQ